MGPAPESRAGGTPRRSPKRSFGTVLAVTALGALAYQVPSSTVIDFSSALSSALSTRDFHDAESGYRWSRGRSEIRFRAPGATRDASLELVLSGFRPRGEAPPLLIVEAPGETFRVDLSRRIEPYTFDVVTSGYLDSDFTVVLRSQVFSPGAGDDRGLGVRVHRAVLTTRGWVRPPARELLLAALLAVLLLLRGVRPSRVIGSGALLSLGLAGFRHGTALGLPLVVAFFAAAYGLEWITPRLYRFLAEWTGAMAGLLRASLPPLRHLALVVGVAAGSTSLAFLARPVVELDLGSGEVAPIAARFGGLDRDGEGIRFREVFAGATLDLRDFGAFRPWTIVVDAAVSSPAAGVLFTAGSLEARAELDPEWRSVSFEVPASPSLWRSGHVLHWPGLGRGVRLKVASLRIERGRSLPSGRVLLLVATIAGLILFALYLSGARGRPVVFAAAAVAALPAALLAASPLVATPFLPTACVGSLASVLVALTARSFLDALAARGLVPVLDPLALAVSLLAFWCWFLASASPLYVGGHFGYHTSIAEEIWRGKFLLYYLPEPENMLARQPQWGNLVVPHSSLFHTLSSPLAALPREWFPLATKVFLAWLLTATAIVSALLATACAGRRAGILAASVLAFLPTGYQLLGLGHLMTLFGCAAASVALGFLLLQAERVTERSIFWASAGLVTLCFLSYTGSLLFASAALAGSAALSFRSDRPFAIVLAKLLLVSWSAALVLYYGSWVAPFLTETIPGLMGGEGSHEGGFSLYSRLLAVPRKFGYSFGSALIPLVGLVGLREVERSRKKRLLEGWALVLIAFTVVDLGFNLLLKHHYFSLPLVAMGVALAFDGLERRVRAGRLIVVLALIAIAALGAEQAWLVARGIL